MPGIRGSPGTNNPDGVEGSDEDGDFRQKRPCPRCGDGFYNLGYHLQHCDEPVEYGEEP